MPLYELTPDAIRPIAETSFHAAGLRERSDLQRLLRSQVEVISPDTLVLAEEFGEWEDSRRRIDLLGLDKEANLVVIELKRTEDGGHMELQAIRYAAMVSAMTFEKAVEIHAGYLSRRGGSVDARSAILDFLGWEEPDEDHFAQDVRIVLVSAEFSKELTTAVMWLNERGLDIRCVRLRPHADNGRVLVNVEQVIPLPEASDYVVRIREKEGRERTARREQSDTAARLLRFWSGLLERAKAKTNLHGRTSPSTINSIGATAGITGAAFNYALNRKASRAELYIYGGDKAKNKRFFDLLLASKDEIEARFGGPLGWERLDDNTVSRIRTEVEKSWDDESEWPALQDAMIDAMIRLEKALRPVLDTINE